MEKNKLFQYCLSSTSIADLLYIVPGMIHRYLKLYRILVPACHHKDIDFCDLKPCIATFWAWSH